MSKYKVGDVVEYTFGTRKTGVITEMDRLHPFHYRSYHIDDAWVDERLIIGLVTPPPPPSDSPQLFDWMCGSGVLSGVDEATGMQYLKTKTEDAIADGEVAPGDSMHLYKVIKHATAVVKCETTIAYAKVGDV